MKQSSDKFQAQMDFNAAIQLHQRGQLEQARAIYERILKSHRRHADALNMLGVIELQTQQYSNAVQLINKAIAIEPNQPGYYMNRGAAFRELKKFELAIVNYDQAIQLNRDYAEAYFNRANANREIGKLDRAVADYTKAIGLRADYADAYINRGVARQQQQQLDAAVADFDKAIELNPQNPVACCRRGDVLQQLKRFEAALADLDKAVAFRPDYAEAHRLRGDVQQELGRFAGAIAAYDKAIASKPDYVEALINRGVARQLSKDFQAALNDYDKAISLNPDYAEAHNNRGNALQDLGEFAEAAMAYETATRLKPDYVAAYISRGNALQQLNLFDGAVPSYDKAIALQPDHAEAFNNRGAAYLELKQFDKALADYDRAIALKPQYAEAYANRGHAFRQLEKHEAAVSDYDTSIGLRSDHAETYFNRGTALIELNRVDEAIADYDKAIALKPDHADAHWNMSFGLLLKGEFEKGFELYEWRWQSGDMKQKQRTFPQPLWLGKEPLQGKTILLHSEQGFGDTLHFCRYAPILGKTGARVVLEVPQPMVGFLRCLEGVSQIVARGDALPAFDYHCPLLSLPLAFRTTLDTIPADVPYLKTEPERREHWSKKLGEKKGLRVGLAWSGSPSYRRDHKRSMSLETLCPYLPRGAEYFSLQTDLRESDAPHLDRVPIRFFGDELADFADNAALCDLMDVVISVDTSVGLLAGALGKPTWSLLHFAPDFRWMLDRTDSPWFPTIKLYRQVRDMVWDDVLQNVQRDLQVKIAGG